jgi:hypothetical protein
VPKALYASRYVRSGAEELVRFICEDLHRCNHHEALRFYDEFRHITTDPRDFALLAANDRYFLLVAILGRRDMLTAYNPEWLYERCREVEAHPDGYLDLWARYHYKSSIITFGGIIQEIIRDPEITIGIFSHTRNIAQKFLSQIKHTLETNDLLKTICPDVFWDKPRTQAPMWSLGGGLCVIRQGNPKEQTVEAWGLVDGQPTGVHFKLLVYDDVVTLKSISAQMAPRTTEAWEMSDNLGVGEATRKWHIGTRYSHADTYQELINRKIFKVRFYPATKNGKLNGIPVFMSPAAWESVKKKQRKTVAAQMLQNPAAGGEASFDLGLFKNYEIRPSLLNVYITCDPAGQLKRTSDRTAMIVTGVDIAKNKYLLDGFCHRMRLADRWANLKMLVQKWRAQPGVQNVEVGYERYGHQSDIEHFEQRMLDEKNLEPFRIIELNWAGPETIAKESRINRLQPDFEGTDYKYYFPHFVYVPGEGTCTWEYERETGQIVYTLAEEEMAIRIDGKVKVVRGQIQNTRLQRKMHDLGMPYLCAQPIRQLDETSQPYDLTVRIFEEAAFFPFKQGFDDALDAASRLYDDKMAYLPPVEWSRVKPKNELYFPDS